MAERTSRQSPNDCQCSVNSVTEYLHLRHTQVQLLPRGGFGSPFGHRYIPCKCGPAAAPAPAAGFGTCRRWTFVSVAVDEQLSGASLLGCPCIAKVSKSPNRACGTDVQNDEDKLATLCMGRAIVFRVIRGKRFAGPSRGGNPGWATLVIPSFRS
jgi:hypothetical protein